MELLSKLFYKDRGVWEREYRTRYESAYTTRLDFEIVERAGKPGNPAFFTATPEVIGILVEILRINRDVGIYCAELPPSAREQIVRQSLISELTKTNSIEGVRSTRREIEEVLDAEKGERKKRFYGLAQKYKMLKEGKEIPLNNCEDLRRIYDDLVLAEVQAEAPENVPDGRLFRKGPVTILSPAQKPIHEGTLPEAKICQQIETALAFLHNAPCDILYRIAIFHYLLEYIHPFYDGNGRLGRFLCSYLLSRRLDPVIAFHISDVIEKNRTAYYKAFDVCSKWQNRGDLTPFLLMFLKIVREAADGLRSSLLDDLTKLHFYRAQLSKLKIEKQTARDTCDFLLQATLFSEHRGATRTEIRRHFNIDREKAGTWLRRIPQRLLDTRRIEDRKYYSLDLRFLYSLPRS